jgi:hypothetical protein
MFRSAIAIAAAASFALVSTQALATPNSDWKAVSKALDDIPSASGKSVAKRIAACKITIQKDKSWVDATTVPLPQYGAKAGQTVLLIVMDVPAQNNDASTARHNLSAIWVITNGTAAPLSTWATWIQAHPVPLGWDKWLTC